MEVEEAVAIVIAAAASAVLVAEILEVVAPVIAGKRSGNPDMKKMNYQITAVRYMGMKKIFLSVILITASYLPSIAQNYPERPDPPRLVNDYAGILSSSENQALEDKLDRYDDSTSTQICIVVINSLDGEDKAQYATELGEKWGVGTKHKDNGILILVSKTDRQVFIATGRGVEEFLPDAICEDIIQNKIKPNFRANNYYSGLNIATDEMMARLSGNFVNDNTQVTPTDEKWYDKILNFLFEVFIIIIVIIFILVKILSGFSGIFGGGGGGGGGGFGGFGGGSFGGGGAGGSW